MAIQQAYEEQIEEGKAIVKGILMKLATDLSEPKINDFSFTVTDKDSDHDLVSILDPAHKKIVTKVKESDLADAPATPAVRLRLKTQLIMAVRAYYGV